MERSVRTNCTLLGLAMSTLVLCGSVSSTPATAAVAPKPVVCPAPEAPAGTSASTEPVARTREELEVIAEEVRALAGPWPAPVQGGGITGDAVGVLLRAGEERVAKQLVRRYGDAVRVYFNDFAVPYVPKGCGPVPVPVLCQPITGEAPSTHDVELRLVPETSTIAAGQPGKARLEIRNVGTEPFPVNVDQPVRGVLVRRGTTDVVGYDPHPDLLIPDPRFVVAPGETGSIEVWFSGSRCDGRAGSAVPPGRYGLRAVLPPQIPLGPNVVPLLAPETPVRVVR